MTIEVVVQGPFMSRKSTIDWPRAGMTKEASKPWLDALNSAVGPYQDSLTRLLTDGRPLKMAVRVYGKSSRMKPLDIHDALAQIVDQLTNVLFPRPKGKPIPQTQDRHFWQVGAEKIIDDDERVEIEIDELTR